MSEIDNLKKRLEYYKPAVCRGWWSGKRSRTEAARFKAAGVKAGVPDLFLPVPRGNYHGLWVEMKIKPNKPTQNQLDWIFNLRERNYACEICYSFLEASEAILRYLKNQS